MKNLNVSRQLTGDASASRFESARMLAVSLALSDTDLLAWIDRLTAMASTALAGCSGPDGSTTGPQTYLSICNQIPG